MSQPPDPRTYTPSHLAEKILRDRFRLEGERRRVTALFVDAVGSTPITETIDEEKAYSLMQGFVAGMMESVHRYEGTVTQFRGDGILALFGAPIAHEDSARRAVSAALDMRDSLRALAVEVENDSGLHYEFRIGLNTGPVVVGNIAEDLTMQYAAIGDTVNLAARMEQIAEPGAIYLTDSTYRLVADWCECEKVGDVDIKGKAEPVTVHRAVKEKGARTRMEIAVERGLTPFVGRGQELMILQSYYGQAAEGRGQVAFVSGDAGLGKSRLLLELRRSLGDEVKWIEGHCISFGSNMPYVSVVDTLKRAFGLEEADDDAAIISKVDDEISKWSADAKASAPYLKFLLNVDPGDVTVSGMDPRERRAGILDALRYLLVEQSSERPLVVVIEDLHWVDENSEEALGAMVDVVAQNKVLLLVTYRPGYTDRLGDRSYFNRVALRPLGPEDSEAVCRAVCAAAELDHQLRDLVLAKAEGNPFFVEEVAKSLLESGVLERRNGDLILTRPIQEVRIPDNIQEVILARIDRLESEAKQAIQLASVIGREFTVRLLDRISDMEERLEDALGELKTLELIYEKTFFPELAYMFKHALTHDVAYSTLLKERRKALHLLVARAIEDLYSDRLIEQYETLAHHYYEAQEWPKALDYLLLSAQKASNALASNEAIDFCSKAIEVAEKIGDEAGPSAATAYQIRGLIKAGRGDIEEGFSDLQSTLEIARRIGEPQMEGVALLFIGMTHLFAHDFESTEATFRQVAEIGDEHGLDGLKLAGGVGLWEIHAVTNRHDEAKRYLEEVERLAPLIDDPFGTGFWGSLGVIAHNWKGDFSRAINQNLAAREHIAKLANITFEMAGLWTSSLSLVGQGRFEAALEQLTDALTRSERSGEVFFQARILNTIGWIYGEIQDFEAGIDWNRRSWKVSDQIGAPDPEIECNARLNIGDCLAALGRQAEAEEHFRFVEEIYQRIGTHYRKGAPPEIFMLWRYAQHMLHSYGELWLLRGDADRALSYAEECLELATPSESRRNIVKARRLRGEAFTAQGRYDEAGEELTAALGLADALGNPTQTWKTLVSLARLHRAQGRPEDARAAHARAASIVDEVAAGLKPERREVFLASKAVTTIKGGA